MKKIYLLSLCCLCYSFCQAQHTAISDSLATLNKLRLKTNKAGMTVLTSWGVANIVAGGVGFFTAKNDEVKYFHGMNALWGIVNGGIGAMGLAGVRKEMNETPDCAGMIDRYEANKRLFLINGGLDFAYIGAGIFLTEHAKSVGNNPALWSGFGKSVTMQGIFLLVFDNVMFSMHQHANKKWYRLLQGLCASGNGVGYNYRF